MSVDSNFRSSPNIVYPRHSIQRDYKQYQQEVTEDIETVLRDSVELDAEISALKAMSPHAVVTTNYDELIEPLFPDYERVIGQTILRHSSLSIGEIFKIHGCVFKPTSLVLSKEDYDTFNTDKKYLSAKLLTYFAEHSFILVGYSATDPNIKNVLYDVDRMMRADF